MTTSQAKKKGDTGFKNNLQRPRKTSEGPPSLKHFLPPLAHERRLLFVGALVVGWRVVGLSCAYLMPTLLLLPAPMSNSGKPTSRVSHCVLDVIPTRSYSSRFLNFNVTSIEDYYRSYEGNPSRICLFFGTWKISNHVVVELDLSFLIGH